MLEKQSVYQNVGKTKRLSEINIPAYIIYNKVIGGFWFDFCQELKKYPAKTEKKMHKVLAVPKKVVPLHPLNRKHSCEGAKERVL